MQRTSANIYTRIGDWICNSPARGVVPPRVSSVIPDVVSWPGIVNMDKERTVIIKEKSDGGALKLAAIVALVATSPFWFVLGIVLIGCITGIVCDGGAWPLLTLLALSLIPVVRDRLSGKYDSKRLQQRIDQLELEASQTRLELAQLEEAMHFDSTLKLHATEKTSAGTASQLVEAGRESK